MGAATITITNQIPVGGLRMLTGTITMSSSYAANGDTCAAAGFGVLTLNVIVHDYVRSGLAFSYDYTNGKMKAFYPTGGSVTSPTTVTAVPASTSTATDGATPVTSSAATVPVTTTITPGVGKEVGATADLSTITLSFVAFGL